MTYYNTLDNNNKMRKALQGWIAGGDYNFAATANFNRTTTLDAANKKLVQWQCMVNKKILGRGWQNAAATDRLFYIAIPEHQASNLHYHMVIRIPVMLPKYMLKAQRRMAKLWQVAVPSGAMWISALDDIGDLARVATYATKDLWDGKGIDGFIVSD